MLEKPTIKDAEALGKKYGTRAVIILWFDDEQLGGSSWGKTRSQCEETGRLLDEIWDQILSKRTDNPEPEGE